MQLSPITPHNKRPADQLPSIDSIMSPSPKKANHHNGRILPPPMTLLSPVEGVLSSPPLLKKILSFVLSPDELNTRNVVIRAREGIAIMYSDPKLALMKVCNRWRISLLHCQAAGDIVDIRFRRKLLRSELSACENERRWDILSFVFQHEKIVDEGGTQLGIAYEVRRLKDVVSLLAAGIMDLYALQLQEMHKYTYLDATTSFSQITQIFIPVLNDAMFLEKLPTTFPSLEKLHIFKYQIGDAVNLTSASLRELDIDNEEFTADGDRVFTLFKCSQFRCPRISRLRLSGLKLDVAQIDSINKFTHPLFEALTKASPLLRHLQLEIDMDGGRPIYLSCPSLNKLSVDNYYVSQVFNFILDCPNLRSLYLRCAVLCTVDSCNSIFQTISMNKMEALVMDYVTVYFTNHSTPNQPPLSTDSYNAIIIENLNTNHLKLECNSHEGVVIMYCKSAAKLTCEENTISQTGRPNEVYLEMSANGSTLLRCDDRELRNICDSRATVEIEGIGGIPDARAKITMIRPKRH